MTKAKAPFDLTRSVLFFFFAPFIVFATVGPGDFSFGLEDGIYRITLLLYFGAVCAAGLVLAQQHPEVRLSGMAKFLALFIVVMVLLQLFAWVMHPRPDYKVVEMLQIVIQFVPLVLAIDVIARRMTFEEFANATLPTGLALLAYTSVHLAFFPTKVWGRSLFFGLHPNLGGELVFCIICMVAFAPSRMLRYVCYALAFFCLTALQARSAIVATFMVIVATEFTFRRGAMMATLMVALSGLAAACAALLINPDYMQAATDFVMNGLLRSDDPMRGAGTGFAGRAETWEVAARDIREHPLLGAGFYNTSFTMDHTPIHNGFIKLIAEFGPAGALPAIAALAAGFFTLRTNQRLGTIILANAFMFAFGARTFALSAFPLLLWITILPWKTGAAASVVTERQPAARPARQAWQS